MAEQTPHKYLYLLIAILLLKAAAMMVFIAYGPIGLGGDEAQYWTWSQKLDLGYYSKPPGIAWEILFGTLFFGNTELGVRFGTVCIAFALSLAVYGLARQCNLKPSTAFWCGLIMAFSPLGILSSLFATTDAGFVFFWTLSCTVIAHALTTQTTPHYYLLGFCILLGALFKWPIYILWLLVLCCAWFYPKLRSWHLVGGFFLSLVGLLPSFIWNYSRNWPTFRHVGTTILGGNQVKTAATTPLFNGNFIDFLGAQAALLSPLSFLFFIAALVVLYRQRQQLNPALLFCGSSCFVLIVVYSLMALFQKMQGNWVVFAYPTAIICLGWYLCEKKQHGKAWLLTGLSLSLFLTAVILALPAIQTHSLFKKTALPYSMNPFRDCLGWHTLPQVLQEVGYDPQHHFLFGDRYQMTSHLSFYASGQKRAYFFNLKGFRKNQFSFWPGMAEEQKGKDGIFATVLNDPIDAKLEKDVLNYQKRLQDYFREVRYLGVKPLFESYGKAVKTVLLFECLDYNGREPQQPSLY